MRNPPFADLKVLDLSWVVAGPLIGRVLADYGATVIRLESSKRVDTARVMGPFPGGKPDKQQSALFENCNAGKLGLSLDLSTEQGRTVVRDLVSWADVLVNLGTRQYVSRVGVIRPPGVGIFRPLEEVPKGVSKQPVDGVILPC